MDVFVHVIVILLTFAVRVLLPPPTVQFCPAGCVAIVMLNTLPEGYVLLSSWAPLPLMVNVSEPFAMEKLPLAPETCTVIE